MKDLSRNGLIYSFIPGDSLWAGGQRVQACQDMASKTCQDFVAKSEKARTQLELEQNFTRFEHAVVQNGFLNN